MGQARPAAVRRSRSRTRMAVAASALTLGLVLSACDSADSGSSVTVTSNVTVGPSGGGTTTTSTSGSAGSTTATTPAGSSTKSSTTTTSKTTKPAKTTGTAMPTTSPGNGPGAGPTQPDGFVPRKLKAGEKPPQFVVVSFDGVGWHEKWQYWFGIMQKVPFHFTGFLSGTYMLSDQTKDKYHGPGHGVGKSSISWNTPTDLPVEIADLNKSLAAGNEVGTHFNGHFCSDNPPGGFDWNTADWNNELDQFFSLVKNVDANNNITDKLNLDPNEVKGERTPCLEGHAEDLFPALTAHHMTYDSSFTKHGISWPVQSKTNKIWQIGMAEFPIHGTLPAGSPVDANQRTNHFQITMDYNFYYSQRGASSNGVSQADSAADSAQVLATYKDMYAASLNGNRAPLILGNHFNEWNNNAYSDAIGNFVLQTCGKPDTYCVPFRDLIAWMQVQDPARLAQLQAESPEVSAP